ncbi:hypothetical protein ABT297_33905 [Dactylosporangium sp. NPDC000555]|uniref:hypothetical protein n=1 Tax=Dactylosporangium sp. NPDC000555 TaxID=3154260 RepID=UPI003316BE25
MPRPIALTPASASPPIVPPVAPPVTGRDDLDGVGVAVCVGVTEWDGDSDGDFDGDLDGDFDGDGLFECVLVGVGE